MPQDFCFVLGTKPPTWPNYLPWLPVFLPLVGITLSHPSFFFPREGLYMACRCISRHSQHLATKCLFLIKSASYANILMLKVNIFKRIPVFEKKSCTKAVGGALSRSEIWFLSLLPPRLHRHLSPRGHQWPRAEIW